MRITHLCLAGTITDGWSYQENLLAKYHQKQGHDVTIITSRWVYNNKHTLYRFESGDYYLNDGIHVLRLDMKPFSSPNGRFARFYGVEKALNTASPNILFIHGCQFLDMDKVLLFLRAHTDITTYLDNHADFSNSATNCLSKAINKYLWGHYAKKIEPYVKKFYGVLPARCEFLNKIYGVSLDKIELLVMGADDDYVKKSFLSVNDTKVKYGIKDSDFLIVSGGKIDKFKTQTLLLMDAIRKINNCNIKLIVFGPVDESLRSKVDILVDGDKIKYIGWLNSDESYNLFSIAKLVVFPGRHSVYWEQVAGMGIPMIVKDWNGTHHIDLGGNVEFLFHDDVDEIMKKIIEIIDDKKKYDEMLIVADKMKSFFSYDNIARRCIE